MKKLKVKIGVYCGGSYGRSGEYIAIVEPQYFKNGNLIKSKFRVIEELEIIKKWYAFRTARVTESITEVLEEIEQ